MRPAQVCVALLWAAAIGPVLLGSLPDSPLRPSLGFRQDMIAIAPQGWAFFTRDPREPVDRVYAPLQAGPSAGPEWAQVTYTNSSRRNWLGLKRDARALNVELASLLSEVDPAQWRDCPGRIETCLRERDVPAVAVVNRSRIRALCGSILVERRPPAPWAWSRAKRPVLLDSKIARLEVRCDRDGDRP
ncbi:MAG TPA: SdpA family antimicrobial peptide system protein [Candidatus Polarisedimenticolia bacterium]|nr:SdpA family antimicrobial peptide system protein [Candidatus Polarisedimenticolia bacterium]